MDEVMEGLVDDNLRRGYCRASIQTRKIKTSM